MIGSKDYIYTGILDCSLQDSRMKGGQAIRVTLMSYLLVLTNGSDIRSIQQAENTTQIFSYKGADKNIQVRTNNIHLIFYI
jgi:hypothetical protein